MVVSRRKWSLTSFGNVLLGIGQYFGAFVSTIYMIFYSRLMRVGSKKEGKQFRGIREGGISDNTAYYVFTHAPVS